LVSSWHFLASSTVMAEAPFVIELATTKSSAADMSFGLTIAYSPPCEQMFRIAQLRIQLRKFKAGPDDMGCRISKPRFVQYWLFHAANMRCGQSVFQRKILVYAVNSLP
jgi:hypothetical protein